MRFLCLSDIHGHAAALESVLTAMAPRNIDRVLVAGDLCFPGPEPLATWHLLLRANALCAQGASDRAISTLDLDRVVALRPDDAGRLAQVRAVRAALGELIVARLARLPAMVRIPLPDGGELVLVHGSPADPLEPFTHDMSDDEVRALIGDDPADIIVCGGSHVPFDREVGGVRIIGVGSVGEAPSSDDAPQRHAHATILEIGSEGVTGVEQTVVGLSAPRDPAA